MGGPSTRRAAADRARRRTWWWRRQGLAPGASPRTIEACVRRAGWLPTAGGPGVYLTVRARMPRVSREAIDRAAVDGTPLVEVPGPHARPPVLVPRQDMALALRLHGTSYDRHLAAYLRSGHIDPAAIRRLGSAICRALDEGPLSSADVRKRVQHAGDVSLLAGVLVHLCLHGTIRRFPANARLDSPKYCYELLHPDDRPNLDAEGEEPAIAQRVVERYLRWHGPATVDEICTWSELPRKTARAALEALGATVVTRDEPRGESWLLPQDAPAWHTFDGDDAPHVALLPYRDPLVAAHRPLTVMTEVPDATVLRDGHEIRLGDASVLHHHTVVSGGEIVGIWEYDPDPREVVTRLWTSNRRLAALAAEAAAEAGRFIREQLGDAKLSAVDPPAARATRIAFCRAGSRTSRIAGARNHAASSSRT